MYSHTDELHSNHLRYAGCPHKNINKLEPGKDIYHSMADFLLCVLSKMVFSHIHDINIYT